ncbi:hypothetical protein PIN31115_03382 [Pandoraea iniqua]|uniref:DUF3318 domain-containing protein n=1 Tax=Pandoraea iniqua TaxID=2508288 RepID=A0A5E4WPY3_9BURK|nr:DUF3318 domain-containing protein [Pandoraea iniqua]VVE25859.1 hypothetical protein PIN31115_03382 [Pandoraea iniqua]
MPLEPNRTRRQRPSRRSRHDLLAIRKELVLTRIAVERAELIQVTHNTRERLRNFRWMRYLLPGGLSKLSGLGSLGGLAGSGLKLGGLLERYPLVSSVASIALTGLSHTPVGRVVRRGLKWGGLGVLAYQGFKMWQQSKSGDAADGAAATAGSTDGTGTAGAAASPGATGTRTTKPGSNDGGAPPLI